MSIWLLASLRERRGGLPVHVAARVDQGVGHQLAPRRRRHLAVPRRAHRRPVPDRPARFRPASRREAVHGLDPAARGRRPRLVRQPRPVPVLRVLRDRARADVLPHRWLGLRPTDLRRAEVLHLHDGRFGVHARRHRRHRASSPGHSSATSPSTSSSCPRRPSFATSTGRWLFLAFAIAFAVKVPIFPLHTWLPDAHTQAPDGRLGDPRRCAAEARHLRVPAVRVHAVPRSAPGTSGRCS